MVERMPRARLRCTRLRVDCSPGENPRVESWISELERLQRAGTPVAIVTVIGVSGSTPREVGAKMLVTQDRLIGTIGGGHLEQLAAADARSCFATGKARTFRYPLGA